MALSGGRAPTFNVVLEGRSRLCLPPGREVGDFAGGGVSDIGADNWQNLDGVTGPHAA